GLGPLAGLLIPALTAAALLAAGCLAFAMMPASFDPGRVTWSELEYKASKLGFTTTSHITLETVPSKEAGGEFIATVNGNGLRPEAPEILKLRIASSLLGQDTILDLWLDPHQALAFQSIQYTHGARQRYRAYRFAGRYVHSFLRKPEADEKDLSPDRWSITDDQRFPHPAWAGERLVVTFPTALFYILSTAELSRVGDHVEIPVFSQDSISLMKIRVEDREREKVNFLVDTPGSSPARVRGRREALRLSLHAQPLDATMQGDFELIGFRGDVEILLDPQYRVPLLIEGNVPRVGKVRVRLQKIVHR
ncbi:MAG: hypothetical protein ABIG68_07835, partial [Acidobacteriota bacterium]